MSEETWGERYARERRERLERQRRWDEETRARARALGITEGPRYDIRIRQTFRRGTRELERTRLERGLRWDGRVGFDLIEFYVRRGGPDAGEVSRYIDPADILEVLPGEPDRDPDGQLRIVDKTHHSG